MISSNTFFTDALNAVDNVIGNFVQTVYQNLIQGNETTITLIFTFYVIWLGYRFITHTLSADLLTITRHAILLLVVYTLIMKWSLYNLLVYNVFTNEPEALAQVMVSSAGHLSPGTSVRGALDNVFSSVVQAAAGLMKEGGWSNPAPLIGGVLVFGFGLAMCILSLVLFIYAKMAMAIGLALGPIFAVFLLWDATKGLFTSWLRKLVTIGLIPIVTSAILVLMLSVINETLPSLNQPAQQIGFLSVSTFIALSLATAFLLYQVFNICSSLGGGITLAGIPSATDFAKSALRKTGLPAAGRAAGKGAAYLGKKGVEKIRSRTAKRRAESLKRAALAAQKEKVAAAGKKYDDWVL